jgi:cupin fold WbuC family metalloprotein
MMMDDPMRTNLSDVFRQETPEVYYAPPGFVTIGEAETAWLINRAAEQPRKRSRICFHADPAAAVHDMLIVHHRSCYVRPHRHFAKSETLTVLRGEAVAFIFDEAGAVTQSLPLGPLGGDRSTMYRMPHGVFHGLAIESEWLVFLETTSGPFDPRGSAFPTWAPDGQDKEAADRFMQRIRQGSATVGTGLSPFS